MKTLQLLRTNVTFYLPLGDRRWRPNQLCFTISGMSPSNGEYSPSLEVVTFFSAWWLDCSEGSSIWPWLTVSEIFGRECQTGVLYLSEVFAKVL